jgi:hypothetical protein
MTTDKGIVDADVAAANPRRCRQQILKTRMDIRWHRDQRGHDRCWLDDVKVYSNLPEYKNPYERGLPSRTEFLGMCERFFEGRQGPTVNASPIGTLDRDQDADLDQMATERLRNELLKLRDGIRRHRDRGTSKDWEDDQRLYNLLPDNVGSVTTLPPRAEFLDGCEHFYSTRGDPPKLHEW